MKSWKNRRNMYWILLATAFGLIFPSNQTNYYKNLIGLIFCWMLYLFCFIRNNQEVKEQEQREREKYQKRVELELIRKEKEEIKKQKEKKWFYEHTECPKIISYIMDKYNRDWEQDLYPRDARYHINDIKRQLKGDIEYEERKIQIHNDYIKRLEKLKEKTKSLSRQKELDEKISASQFVIDRCQEYIKDIPQKYEHRIAFYQDEIERYKDQCRDHEQKANELFQNFPEEIIKAIDCHLHMIEEVKQRPLKSRYGDRDTWIKCEEEKLPYLLQAKLDAINRIKEMEN